MKASCVPAALCYAAATGEKEEEEGGEGKRGRVWGGKEVRQGWSQDRWKNKRKNTRRRRTRSRRGKWKMAGEEEKQRKRKSRIFKDEER